MNNTINTIVANAENIKNNLNPHAKCFKPKRIAKTFKKEKNMPAPIFKIIHNAPRIHQELGFQAPQQVQEDAEMGLRGTLAADNFFPKPQL